MEVFLLTKRYFNLDEYPIVLNNKNNDYHINELTLLATRTDTVSFNIEPISSLDTVDITSGFVKYNNHIIVSGIKYIVKNFRVEESTILPGNDKIIIESQKIQAL